MRIVSLIPSATEIVCALGFRDQLVGRSHECDFPADVESLPALTAPKMDPRAGTEAIDRDVRRLVEQGLSVYRIDTEALERLRPDIVVTQDQCQVCAVSLGDVTAAVCQLAKRDVQVVSLSPLSLADLFADALTVARALGAEDRGRELVEEQMGRLAATASAALSSLRLRLRPRPRVAHIEWIAPLMVGGHWMHELVEAAGGEHRLGVRYGNNRPVPWDEVRAYDPEVVVIAPCGFKIPQSERDRGLLERLPGWSETTAARSGRVFLADGNAFFNRPGPRLVDTAEIVQAAMFGRQARHRFPAEALRPLAR
jgi:iron complex transport system substrate-binding protein